MASDRKKMMDYIDKVEDICLIIMFMAMVAAIFLQVIMRFVFNNSLSWSEELGKFLFVWLSWLGIAIGHRRQEHIKITLVVDMLPYKVRKFFELITEIILIIICGITLYYGVFMLKIQIPVPYAGIKISTAWGYLSVILGCGFFIFRSILYIVEIAHALKSPEPIEKGGTV